MVKKFEFCPKCKSTKIQTDFGNFVALEIDTPMKMCNRCGYQSRTFPTTTQKPKLAKFEKVKNNYEPDVQTGFNFEKLNISVFGSFLLFAAVVCLFMKLWLISGLLFVFGGLAVWLLKLLSKK